MTHEYTLLVGGRVLPGGSAPEATAIAWAAGTVLMLGSDAEIHAISRGDSHLVELGGAFVVPGDSVGPAGDGVLEIGGPADLDVFDGDPRGGGLEPVAVVRAGRVIEGSLPGLSDHGPEEHDHPEH